MTPKPYVASTLRCSLCPALGREEPADVKRRTGSAHHHLRISRTLLLAIEGEMQPADALAADALDEQLGVVMPARSLRSSGLVMRRPLGCGRLLSASAPFAQLPPHGDVDPA